MENIFAKRRARLLAMKAMRENYVPGEKLVTCPHCGGESQRKDVAAALSVCPLCGYHFPMGAYYRLSSVLDPGSFRELFEKLPAAEPCEEDYCILNGIFACVGQMKPHNMDIALVNEIRGKKFLDATGNAVHCILGILSLCGILESTAHRGFLHNFTNSGEIGGYRDGLSFYPLFYWRGKNGVNYDAVNEIFGSFSGDRLSPSHAVIPVKLSLIHI